MGQFTAELYCIVYTRDVFLFDVADELKNLSSECKVVNLFI